MAVTNPNQSPFTPSILSIFDHIAPTN